MARNDFFEKSEHTRILIVEDGNVNRAVGVLMLKNIGYDADIAVNGLEAVALAKQNEYDIILMDIHLPGMDGIEATTHIRAHYPENGQPMIIAMTADDMSERRKEYLSYGMDDFIVKPIQEQDLLRALAACGTPANDAGKCPPTGGGSSVDVTNLSEITSMAEGNDEVVARWITIFLEDAPRIVDEMEDAVSKNNAAIMAQRAHSLKSQSRLMGARRLSELAKKLEFAGKDGKLAEMADNMFELKIVFEKVRISLESELAKRRP